MPLMKRQEFKERCDALESRYPLMFADVQCGVSLLPGWMDLLEWLCADIDAAMSLRERRVFRVGQIKEKFGGLRFYASGHNDRSFELVREAERLSHGICVFCGAPGTMRNGSCEEDEVCGWIHPACDEHVNRDRLFNDEDE